MPENNPQFGQVAPYSVQPSSATPPGYAVPAAYYGTTPLVQKRGLGIAGLILAVVVFIGSLIWAVANGLAASALLGPVTGGFDDGFNAGVEVGSSPEGAGLSLSILSHLIMGTLAGVAALVLGIVAVALKRGRAQGVAAIIIAAVAPVVSFIAYTVAGAVSAI